MWKKILQFEFEQIIYTAFSHEYATGGLLTQKIYAKHKIAPLSDYAIDAPFWINKMKNFFTQIICIDDITLITHELAKNAKFVSALSNRTIVENVPYLVHMADAKIPVIEGKYYVIFPGARVPIREWPISNYVELCNLIDEKYNITGLVCGSKADFKKAETIISTSKAKLLNYCGKTTLLELISVIKNSLLLIGNETSGVHIAEAVGTTSICILGGGHFQRFVPYPAHMNPKMISVFHEMPCFHCDWNCIYQISKSSTVPCVSHISTWQVWQKADMLLNTLAALQPSK